MKSGIGVKEHLPWLQQLPLDLLAQPPATYSKLDTKHLLPFGGFMLSFTQALKSGWARRYEVRGRSCRSEFWWNFLAAFLMIMLSGMFSRLGAIGGLLGLIVYVAAMWLLITVGIRRLHDRDMAGWWLLLNLIPTLGFLALVVIMSLKGTPGLNRFGYEPLSSGFYDTLFSGNPQWQQQQQYQQQPYGQPQNRQQNTFGAFPPNNSGSAPTPSNDANNQQRRP